MDIEFLKLTSYITTGNVTRKQTYIVNTEILPQ